MAGTSTLSWLSKSKTMATTTPIPKIGPDPSQEESFR